MNESLPQESQSSLKVLKYPGIGLYMSFKLFVEILGYIFQCAWRGFIFIFKDIPVLVWNHASKNVDEAVKEVSTKGKESPKKKSFFTMDLNDLLQNSKMMQKKLAGLQKDKLILAEELKGAGGLRSKETRVFRYTAKNKAGKLETSIINGYSKLDVNTFLVQDGYEVYKIENNKTIDFIYGQSSFLATKMSTKDLLFWLTQLSTYLKSGISLTESIRILNQQMNKKGAYKKSFQSIIYELTMGESFSNALAKQGTMFPAFLINMIKAAEATGQLQETLEDMANYYSEIDKTKREMISALTYPAIISVFSLAVVTFIMVYVVPKFVSMYDQAGAKVTGMTLFVVNTSAFLQANFINMILMIVLIVLVVALLYKKVKAFRRSLQILAMKLPVFGNIIKYNEMTIFAKTFASLLHNNVFITESIDILSKITNNEIYKEIMYNTINNIVKGEKISKAFKDHWAVPDVAYYMIVTGESTGQLAEMMSKVSEYYQEMHRNAINSLKAFIEPITIAFLAFIVGGIILSVILPMFQLMNEIQ